MDVFRKCPPTRRRYGVANHAIALKGRRRMKGYHMKKLLLTVGALTILGGSTPRLQAEPVALLTAAHIAALIAAGTAATGKLVHLTGALGKEFGACVALGVGGLSACAAYPLFQSLAYAGCIAAEWPWPLFYTGIAATAVAGVAKLSLDPVLKSYSNELKKMGSGLMHAGGLVGLLGGALCLAHCCGY